MYIFAQLINDFLYYILFCKATGNLGKLNNGGHWQAAQNILQHGDVTYTLYAMITRMKMT